MTNEEIAKYLSTISSVKESIIDNLNSNNISDEEFYLPKKMQELVKKRDFGKYADKNGNLVINFLNNCHTSSGNSGSPVINAKGELIGLNFDRVWEGTMSDVYYDPAICRNIMVDMRYVLFIIDKYAGAKNLISEMKLVHPKNKKKTTKKQTFKKKKKKN